MTSTRYGHAVAAARHAAPCAFAVFAAAVGATLAAAPFATAHASTSWSARVRMDGGYNSVLFPGFSAPTPDYFARVAVTPAVRVRFAKDYRLACSATVATEDYRRWPVRDNQRYEADARLRRRDWRLPARVRVAPHALLYLDGPDEVVYRGREATLGLSRALLAGLAAGVEFRSETQRYDVAYAGRDAIRTRWAYSLDWDAGSRRTASIAFENTRSQAADPNYDHWRNEITLAAEAPAGPAVVRVETTQGIKNYFPESLFASNYRRHDGGGSYRAEVAVPVTGVLGISLADEYRAVHSTKPHRSYHRNLLILSFQWAVGA